MERKLGLQTVMMLHHTDVCSVSWLSRGSDFTAVGISFHFIFPPEAQSENCLVQYVLVIFQYRMKNNQMYFYMTDYLCVLNS
jgi:hypothetical protein